MSTANPGHASISDFVKRWERSGSAERGNFQSFASELCDLLGVPRPDHQHPSRCENPYVFDRSVNFGSLAKILQEGIAAVDCIPTDIKAGSKVGSISELNEAVTE